MKGSIFAASTAAAFLLCASPAIADHNSPQGPGWANMPNDIHNTRVETLDSNDNEAFRDFVKYGEGADSARRRSGRIRPATEHARARHRLPSRQSRWRSPARARRPRPQLTECWAWFREGPRPKVRVST